MPVYPGRVSSAPWGDHGRDAAAPQQQGLFSILAGDKVGKLRRGISKSFISRLSTTEPLKQEGGREHVRPDPAAPLCPPHPCRQQQSLGTGVGSSRCCPPFQKVSVLSSAVWGVVQNRQRAQLDTALLHTKGINNPAGDESSFSAQDAKSTNCLLVRERLNFHRT